MMNLEPPDGTTRFQQTGIDVGNQQERFLAADTGEEMNNDFIQSGLRDQPRKYPHRTGTE